MNTLTTTASTLQVKIGTPLLRCTRCQAQVIEHDGATWQAVVVVDAEGREWRPIRAGAQEFERHQCKS